MSRPDRRLIYLLSVAYRRMETRLRALGDTSGTQAGVLFYLHAHEGAALSDLAHALSMGLPGASGLVDRMATAGLVERRAHDHDGRQWRLFLTRRGHALREAASSVAHDLNTKLAGDFTDKELDVVARWLDHVAATFAPTSKKTEENP